MKAEQIIVALGREFGSGGREIARKLAERLQISLYDRNLLETIAAERLKQVEELERYDERCGEETGYGNSLTMGREDRLARLEFEYIRERAASGKSFVVVGHCAEEILKQYPGLVSIFIHADRDFRIRRVMEREVVSEQEAFALMRRIDQRRRAYHDHFCASGWGEEATYDLVVNSSWLGIDGTVGMLERYLLKRRKSLAQRETTV